MRWISPKQWLALSTMLLASVGCSHSRSQKVPESSCSTCSTCSTCGSTSGPVFIGNRSPQDASTIIVQPMPPTPIPTPTVVPNPAPMKLPESIPIQMPKKEIPPTPMPIPKKEVTPKLTPMPMPMPKKEVTPEPMPKKELPPFKKMPPLEISAPSTLPPLEIGSKPLEVPMGTSLKISPMESGMEMIPAHNTVATFASNSVATGKSSHANDYSWVTGQLEYLNSKKVWRLRYAGHDEEDVHGGTITLMGADHLLDHYKDGDQIKVEGQLLDLGNHQVSPHYQVNTLGKVR